jgi:hypothetical protein
MDPRITRDCLQDLFVLVVMPRAEFVRLLSRSCRQSRCVGGAVRDAVGGHWWELWQMRWWEAHLGPWWGRAIGGSPGGSFGGGIGGSTRVERFFRSESSRVCVWLELLFFGGGRLVKTMARTQPLPPPRSGRAPGRSSFRKPLETTAR